MSTIEMRVQPSFGPARAWYLVSLLCVLYGLSLLDRLILVLLLEPISAELSLSDTKLGMLIGVNFGVLYSLVALPAAQMIDSGHRIRWLSAGVLLWSATTVASAFANSFAELALCRAGVAIGEAVLSPAAMSLIGDIFPRGKRVAPTTTYMAVSSVMGAGSFAVGGWIFAVSQGFTAVSGMEAWRLTLFFVGVPGILLSPLLLLTVREPNRVVEPSIGSYATPREAWGFVVAERRLYGWVFVGMAAFTVCGSAFSSWTPTVLIRKFGVSVSDAGYLFGLCGAALSILGAVVWPSIIQHRTRQGRPEVLPLLMAVTMGVAIAAMALFGLATNLTLALIASGVFFFAAATSTILPPLIIQSAAPGQMRARLMAGNLLALNMIGYSLGPWAAAAIGESFFEGPMSVSNSYIVLAMAMGPLVCAAFMLARKQYSNAYHRASARENTT